jgi:hypothetical protein
MNYESVVANNPVVAKAKPEAIRYYRIFPDCFVAFCFLLSAFCFLPSAFSSLRGTKQSLRVSAIG